MQKRMFTTMSGIWLKVQKIYSAISSQTFKMEKCVQFQSCFCSDCQISQVKEILTCFLFDCSTSTLLKHKIKSEIWKFSSYPAKKKKSEMQKARNLHHETLEMHFCISMIDWKRQMFAFWKILDVLMFCVLVFITTTWKVL